VDSDQREVLWLFGTSKATEKSGCRHRQDKSLVGEPGDGGTGHLRLRNNRVPLVAPVQQKDFLQVLFMCMGTWEQRWAKGPIDRSSDTDSIFRLYRTIQSVDAKFRFLNRPIVSVRFEFRFFNRPILFLGLKFWFWNRPIMSVRFEFRFFNRPILFFGFKFRFLYRPIV
jgi:hypothetical protein